MPPPGFLWVFYYDFIDYSKPVAINLSINFHDSGICFHFHFSIKHTIPI